MALLARAGTDLVTLQEYVQDNFFGGTGAPELDLTELSSQQNDCAYIQELDLCFLPFERRGGSPLGRYLMGFDPQGDTSRTRVSSTILGHALRGVLAGQHDPEGNNTQRLYGWIDESSRLREYNTGGLLDEVSSDPFPNLERRSGGTNLGLPTQPTTPDGWWTDTESRFLIFESLTDGIPNEVTEGSNLYPEGLALVCGCDEASLTADNAEDDRHIWVDIDTGEAVGVLQNLSLGLANIYDEPVSETIGSASVRWRRASFYPDSDSTWAQPKGFIVWSPESNNTQDSSDSPAQAYAYFKITEFNPFSATGAISRVHGREIFRSRAKYPIDPIIAGGTTLASNVVYRKIHWSPTQGVYFVPVVSSAATEPEAGFQVLRTFESVPEVAVVTPASDPGEAQVGATRDLGAVVSGDLGELITGAIVTWSASRISTNREALDVSGVGAGGSVVVANAPMDDAPKFVQVYEDGVLLTETTHYTLTRSTGTITFVSPLPDTSKAYTVSYSHRDSPASPSHGTLLTTQSVTDANGRAKTQIRYPSNAQLSGHFDEVTCSADDDD